MQKHITELQLRCRSWAASCQRKRQWLSLRKLEDYSAMQSRHKEYDDKALTKAQSLETFDTMNENELSRRREGIIDKKKRKKKVIISTMTQSQPPTLEILHPKWPYLFAYKVLGNSPIKIYSHSKQQVQNNQPRPIVSSNKAKRTDPETIVVEHAVSAHGASEPETRDGSSFDVELFFFRVRVWGVWSRVRVWPAVTVLLVVGGGEIDGRHFWVVLGWFVFGLRVQYDRSRCLYMHLRGEKACLWTTMNSVSRQSRQSKKCGDQRNADWNKAEEDKWTMEAFPPLDNGYLSTRSPQRCHCLWRCFGTPTPLSRVSNPYQILHS